MRAALLVVLGLEVAALVAALARWLRVAQREHYLPGAATRFARRWWAKDRLGLGAAAIGLGAVAAAVFVPVTAGVAGVVVLAGPPGLTLRGRTAKLAWTRRLRTLAAAAVVLSLGAFGAGAAFGLRWAVLAGAAVSVAAFVVVDLALVLVSPLEERLAMRHVARARRQLERVQPVVVAITGSYGKTSTKGYVAHLLAGRFEVLASPRSYNNRAGLAYTANELLMPGTEVFVAEMGTYGRGEIAALCSWLPPKIAAITAIGPVHLERFGSLEVTLAAKSEITEGAELSVLNVDDLLLARLAGRLTGSGRHVLRCSGRDRSADVAVIAVRDGFELFTNGGLAGTVHLDPARATPVATNVAVAVGIAIGLGLEPPELLERLGDLPVPENRLDVAVRSDGLLVLDDTFNSNPAGARLALDALQRLGTGRRRVLVTPGMVELGPLQEEENAAFAKDAAAAVSDLVVVGRTNRRALVRGAAEAPRPPRLVLVERRQDALSWVRRALGPGDAVLYENDLPDHYP